MTTILVLSILINVLIFSLKNALKPGIGFWGLRVYWHCPFSCAIQTEAVAAILILSFIFDYWHNVLEAVVSDLWTLESLHQLRGI